MRKKGLYSQCKLRTFLTTSSTACLATLVKCVDWHCSNMGDALVEHVLPMMKRLGAKRTDIYVRNPCNAPFCTEMQTLFHLPSPTC